MSEIERQPVVVGAGQVTNRETDASRAPDPFALMEEAVRLAVDDAGGGIPGADGFTHVWMVHSLSLRHGDPANELARRLRVADGASVRVSGMGGNIPQWLVNRAADQVRRGVRPRIVIVGAEALATKRRTKRAGVKLDWPSAPGWPETWPPLDLDFGVHPVEAAHGLSDAITMYALIESALAHDRGETRVEHAASMGRLFETFGRVGAANPVSWFTGVEHSAEELVTAGADNRMVSLPYTKYLTAVMDVDMAAAVIVTDARSAADAGLGPGDVAHVAGSGDATDVWHLSARPAVARSRALAACVSQATAGAGFGVDEVGAFDLYACFPSAVEVAMDELGLSTDDPRPLTLTGGLPIHGGPGSNYVTHAVGNALARVRAGGGPVLVHGNGYYLTKQSVGIYADRPGVGDGAPAGEALDEVKGVVTGEGALAVVADASGHGRIVGFTVPYGRDGVPGAGIVLVDVHGVRTVALGDAELTAALVGGDDLVGTAVSVASADTGAAEGRPGNIASI